MTDAIAVSGLVKTFGTSRALNGLDLRVGTGEVHGFLGPNGAGKTTTIRVLLGLLRADAGTVSLLGGDPWRDAVRLHTRLAYVPGDVSLWPNLTGGEAIDLFGHLRGGLDRARRTELVERFQLDPTKRCRTYSKGNRQKVALIAAFASDVELFVLDEPTSGLDPLMEAAFQQTVREVSVRGATVLLSSHRGGARPVTVHPRAPDPGGCRDGRAARRAGHRGHRTDGGRAGTVPAQKPGLVVPRRSLGLVVPRRSARRPGGLRRAVSVACGPGSPAIPVGRGPGEG
ncbi:ABC transporter ATP-binding protein [Nonomuraea sp. NPDC049709]|uniref:ABC transporter ATP-binding protein n=1 Tax=Nonomuraea sp. NPDC049709 TaxID=3154736 RepID=UPI0034417D8B